MARWLMALRGSCRDHSRWRQCQRFQLNPQVAILFDVQSDAVGFPRNRERHRQASNGREASVIEPRVKQPSSRKEFPTKLGVRRFDAAVVCALFSCHPVFAINPEKTASECRTPKRQLSHSILTYGHQLVPANSVVSIPTRVLGELVENL